MSRHHLKLDRARWERTRVEVFHRAQWKCQGCGLHRSPYECDHVVPLHVDRHQDPYDPANCQCLCVPCHIAKTRGENRRPPTPAELAWHEFVAGLANSP